MKSSLNQEAFAKFIAAASTEDKNKMVATGALYGAWVKKDDVEKLSIAYNTLHKQVTQMEEKYGIKFVSSPDENYYRAFLLLSDWAQKVLLKLQQQKNQVYKIQFSDVKEANAWLQRNRVDAVSMELQTGTRLGLLANHTTVKSVVIHYKKNEKTKYFYRVFEEEELGLFVKKNKSEIGKRWRENHPGLDIIDQRYSSNSRGDVLSMAVGFGQYAEHVKVITLSRGASCR